MSTIKPIILGVGHTPTLSNILDSLLRGGEFTTLYAGSTAEVLSVISLRPIEAVIVDVGSPRSVAALQFLEAFRFRNAHHYTPVALLNRAGSMTPADVAIARRHRARVLRYVAEVTFWLEEVTAQYPSAIAS